MGTGIRPTDPFGWVGHRIDGKYPVEDVAADGGFGVVYKGYHPGFDRTVAIKCLKIPGRLDQSKDGEFIAAFRSEATLLLDLAALTAHIVRPLDFGAAITPTGVLVPYIVLEWLEGETLADDLQRRRKLGLPPRSLADTIQILTPAAEALSIAHRKGIAHRDIKPANLFLVSAGDDTLVKVLDFGIAKVLEKTLSATQAYVQTGTALDAFTPQYAAPEQFNSIHGATGPWSDVFAMALLFIEVACGKPALEGSREAELYFAASRESRRSSLAARGVEAPPALERVLSRALDVEPARRHRTLGEMWQELLGSWRTSPARREPAAAAPKAATPSPDEERRHCTVLFADLSQIAALAERLDTAVFHEILTACCRAFQEQVARLDGSIEKMNEERLKAVFGVPKAREDDTERAIRAALYIKAALVEVSRAYRKVLRPAPTIRVGINTGFVQVGGAGERRDGVTIGNVVSVATRLQEQAPPGGILIGRDSRHQVLGLFNMSPFPAAQPTDRGEPVSAYLVTGATTIRHAIPASDFYGLDTKFVGRADVMQAVIGALDQVLSDRRAALVTLVGPAGVGRTRIMGEMAGELAGRTATYFLMMTQCVPTTADTSYSLVASLIRARFSIHEEDPVEVITRKLTDGIHHFRSFQAGASDPGPEALEGREALSRSSEVREPEDAVRRILAAEPEHPADLGDAPAQIAKILGARPPSTLVHESLAPDDRGTQAKHRITAAMAQLLRALSATAPIVLMCDDVQWGDDASLDMLDDLLVRLPDVPLFVLCTARSELFERRPLWGQGTSARSRIEVGALAPRSIEEMIRDRLRKVSGLSTEFVRDLAERAEGYPLIVHEALHLLMDDVVIERRETDSWIVHEQRLQKLELPGMIQRIVQVRLDHLDPDTRLALGIASVMGRTFWEGAVARLRAALPSGGMAQSRETTTARPTEDLLRLLRDRQMIRCLESSAFPADREYTFSESAILEVAYETLLPARRRLLHRQAAAWLAERLPTERGAALIASHWARGGDVRRAAAEYVRAAVHAASLGQNAQALRHLERARQIHDATEEGSSDALSDPDFAGTNDARVAGWRDRTRLRLELGDVLRRLGRLDEAERSYREARAHILREERRADEAFDARTPLRWHATVDFRLGFLERIRGTKQSMENARSLVERAIESTAAAGAPEEAPPMYAELAAILRRLGEPRASTEACLRGLRVCGAVKATDMRSREAISFLLSALGVLFRDSGKLVRAERCCRQAVRVLSNTGQVHATCMALNTLGAVLFEKADLPGARDTFLQALALTERTGDLRQLAIAYNNVAEVEILSGAAANALKHAQQSVRLGEQARADGDLPDFYRNLASAFDAAGQPEAALEQATIAHERARAEARRVYLGSTAVTLARTCRAVRDNPRLDDSTRRRAERIGQTLLAQLTELTAIGAEDEARQCKGLLSPLGLGRGRGRARASSTKRSKGPRKK